MALAAYRQILRATRIAFHEDYSVLHAARTQARKGFDKQSSLDPASQEATKAIEHAEGVARILRHNVVQGVRGENDVLSMQVQLHLQQSLTYHRTPNTSGHGKRRQ